MPYRFTFDFAQSNDPGWQLTDPYNDKSIDTIEVKLTPTEMPRVAVPSPFARFELMQKAFRNVAEKGKAADVRDKKLVSHSLDVLQLVFEGISDPNLGIIKWYLNDATSRLIERGERLGTENPGLKLYGETLRDYAMREKYGLNDQALTGGMEPILDIIAYEDTFPLAMTCPTSLFLPTSDYENPIWKERFKLQGEIPIFSVDRDLIDRDPAFIKYVIALVEEWKKEFDTIIPSSLNDFVIYVDNQSKALVSSGKSYINKEAKGIADQGLDNEYQVATINNEEIDVLGLKLFRIRKDAEDAFIKENSTLVIRETRNDKESNFESKGTLPLVLSNNISYRNHIYTSATTFWDSKDSNLDYNDRQLRELRYDRRKLPNGKEYSGGFIYEHDLLSDQLWLLPYNLNDDKFEKIWVSNELEGFSFLPPVTDLFFKYFDIQYLLDNMKMEVKSATLPNGKKKIVNVTVKLDINVRGDRRENKIQFKKVYNSTDSIESAMDIENSGETSSDIAQGNIMIVKTALTIFPFVRFENTKLDNYSIQLVREPDLQSSKHYDLDLDIYGPSEDGKGYESLDIMRAIRRVQDDENTVRTYGVSEKEIAYFKLKLNKSEAVLIPKWKKRYAGGSQGLSFAFDFGTSNSYVAVSDDPERENPKMKLTLPVDFMASTINEDPGVPVNSMLLSFGDYVNQDLLPRHKGRVEKPFPMRSVLSTPKKELDHNSDYDVPFLKSSIPFLLGYDDYGMMHNRLVANLKWLADNVRRGEQNDDVAKVPAYINELMWLAQVYAVSKDASLNQCSIIWTYPISMSPRQIQKYQKYWIDAYKKYFNPNIDKITDKVRQLPESVAPLLKLQSSGVPIENTGISIDIGGGTCDVVIYNGADNEKWRIASFRFGAEVIFGIQPEVDKVPMVKNALQEIASAIEEYAESKPALKTSITNLAKKLRNSVPRMQDVTSALFAVEDQDLLKEKAKSFSFNKWLQNHYEYHYLIYFYYGAIIYYVCKLIEFLNENDIDGEKYDRLETIFFSGSGSKILNIISEENPYTLTDITKEMILHFSNDEIRPKNFEIEMSKEPKEVTAKGALGASQSDIKRFQDSGKYEVNYLIIDTIDKKNHERLLEGDKPKKLEKEVLFKKDNMDAVIDSVIDYLKLYAKFIKKHVDEDIALEAQPFIESLQDDGKWDRRDIETKLKNIYKELEEDDEIDDTPFFAVLERIILKQMQRRR